MFSCSGIFKNSYIKEHLVTAASGVILESDCFELCFWTIAFKAIMTHNIIKIPFAFKPEI